MGWFKDLFSGKPQNGVGGEGPTYIKINTVVELHNHLITEFLKYPSLIAVLDVNHKDPYTGTPHSKKLHLKLVDGAIIVHTITNDLTSYQLAPELTEDNILTIVAANYGSHGSEVTLQVDWTLSWITPSTLPKTTKALVTNAVASAIPFTARQVFEDTFVIDTTGDDTGAVYQNGQSSNVRSWVPFWYTDLAFSEGVLQLPADPNKYIITDQYQVDRKILPNRHWRRWVHVTEAANNSKAAVKFVPRGSGCGYVQYFDVAFVFDDPETAGMTFDAGELLGSAIDRLQSQLDLDIPDKPIRYYAGSPISIREIKSDVYINPDHVKVSWQDKLTTLQDWLDLQRESETNLERPYFSPNLPVTNIGGNRFSIDADYYINHTQWTQPK